MLVAPVIMLIAAVVSPPLESSAAAQLAVVTAHPTCWYVYTLLVLIGAVILVAAMVGLLQLSAARMRRIGTLGGVLVTLGALASVVDWANQLWLTQMVRPGADRAQMTALLDRFDNTAATNIPFAVTGIGLLIGTGLLTTALVRNPAVPSWAAIVFGTAIFVNVLALSADNGTVVTIGRILLLAGMGGIGGTQLRNPTPTAKPAAPVSATPTATMSVGEER